MPITPLEIYIGLFINLIDRVIVPLVFALAFIVFITGIFQYFIAGGANDEKQKQGKQLILYGMIGFFVMVSVWGLVNLFTGTFGFGAQNRPMLPTFGNGQTHQPDLPRGAACNPANHGSECVTGGCGQVGNGPWVCD